MHLFFSPSHKFPHFQFTPGHQGGRGGDAFGGGREQAESSAETVESQTAKALETEEQQKKKTEKKKIRLK